jgi:dimethylamine monooxygenase subunit A
MPWPVSAPFRMRPNLEKLDAESPALLLRDELAPAYTRERERVLRDARERASVGVASHKVLNAIASFVGAACRNSQSYLETRVSTEAQSLQAALTTQTIALSLQEDFVILKKEDETLRTEYLSVCFPSRWDPREKLGLDFSQIHAPVADNQMLLAAGRPRSINILSRTTIRGAKRLKTRRRYCHASSFAWSAKPPGRCRNSVAPCFSFA